jgi:hypothetical protein
VFSQLEWRSKRRAADSTQQRDAGIIAGGAGIELASQLNLFLDTRDSASS